MSTDMVGLEHWSLARPELFLAGATALLLLYGVLRGEVATAFISPQLTAGNGGPKATRWSSPRLFP